VATEHDVRIDNVNLISLINPVYAYPRPDNVTVFFTETEGNSALFPGQKIGET
jgi:hypothetical protein